MAIGLALSACAVKPPPPSPQWVRTDGQRLSDNPALTQQLEIDVTVCRGDTQRTNLSSLTPVETNKYSWGLDSRVEGQRTNAAWDAMNGCMAQKGYMLFAADQAEAAREQFAVTTAQRRAAATPVPPATTRHAAPKPLPPQAQQQ
jgi:hypothetical protein